MFSFDELTTYGEKWSVKNSESLSEVAINAVASTEVVNSNYGLSVCFHMVKGGTKFIPLSNNCSLNIGDTANLSKGRILTLEKAGEADIYRWEE